MSQETLTIILGAGITIALIVIGVFIIILLSKEFNKLRSSRKSDNTINNRQISSYNNYDEFLVYKILKEVKEEIGGHILQNIIIKDNLNRLAEIDLIYINKTGIYVIEVKGWKGTIFGDEESKNWNVINDDFNEKRENPIKQNLNHVDILSNYLDRSINVCSLIVFTNGNIDSIEHDSVCRVDELKDILLDREEEVLSDLEVENYFNKLKRFVDNPVMSHKEYVDYINNLHN